ncbi:MAG: LCP family protein [Acetatifactor sp.]
MNNDSRRTSVNEMEQIQRGLEEFLDREPQFFTIEEEEMKEKEIDVIGVKSRRILGEDYVEDWDSKERRSAQVQRTQNSNARREGAGSRSVKKNTTKKESAKSKNKPEGRRKRKKKSGFRKVLLVLIILLALLGGGFYYLVGAMYDKMNYAQIDSLMREPMKEEGVVNILLIGNDSRENGADGRSDAMILLSISNKTKKIYMTSLLRDMYVEIPGHDGNRLNAAYSFGGAELLMETIEKNLDITVNRYVLVNFEAFANLVDAVGGIELELSQEEIEYVNGYLVEYNMLTDRPQGTDNMDTSVSGLVHLNGPQALAYSRNRYLGTDFGRTERQRKVLTEVIHRLPKALLTNPKELVDGLLPNLTTNLTKNECVRLGLMGGRALTYDIVQDSIPQKGTYSNATIRGMAVLEVDFEANKRYLRENIFGE